MNSDGRLPRCASVVQWLIPKYCREPVIGDLIEEYWLLCTTGRQRNANLWIIKQVVRSTPLFLRSQAVRESWHITLLVAAMTFLAVGFIEPRLMDLIATLLSSDGSAHPALAVAVSLATVVVAAFCAALIRSSAAIAFAIMMMAAMIVIIASGQGAAVLPHYIFLGLCPAAALVGRQLCTGYRRSTARC